MMNKNCCTPRRKPLKAQWAGFATRCAAVRPPMQKPASSSPGTEKVLPMSVPVVLPMSVPRTVRGNGACEYQKGATFEIASRIPGFGSQLQKSRRLHFPRPAPPHPCPLPQGEGEPRTALRQLQAAREVQTPGLLQL